jgi:hypothetical protein
VNNASGASEKVNVREKKEMRNQTPKRDADSCAQSGSFTRRSEYKEERGSDRGGTQNGTGKERTIPKSCRGNHGEWFLCHVGEGATQVNRIRSGFHQGGDESVGHCITSLRRSNPIYWP